MNGRGFSTWYTGVDFLLIAALAQTSNEWSSECSWYATPLFLVFTYVVCERLCVMHKQVSVQTVNLFPNSPESPLWNFRSESPPSLQMKTSDLSWPKFRSEYPSPQCRLQFWVDQSSDQSTPPDENFRFELTKVQIRVPPPLLPGCWWEFPYVETYIYHTDNILVRWSHFNAIQSSVYFVYFSNCYLPRTKLREDNVFSPACLSVHRRGPIVTTVNMFKLFDLGSFHEPPIIVWMKQR